MLGHYRRVLVIGAHPDDEDTELLTVLVRGMGAEAAYLSLNRGEGGQNLIGPELGEALGLIRTEELLAARRLDGARQYFTRAYDFGYSKTLDETWTHWPRGHRPQGRRADRAAVPAADHRLGLQRHPRGRARPASGGGLGSASRRSPPPATPPGFPSWVARRGSAPWTPLKLYRSTRFDTHGHDHHPGRRRARPRRRASRTTRSRWRAGACTARRTWDGSRISARRWYGSPAGGSDRRGQRRVCSPASTPRSPGCRGERSRHRRPGRAPAVRRARGQRADGPGYRRVQPRGGRCSTGRKRDLVAPVGRQPRAGPLLHAGAGGPATTHASGPSRLRRGSWPMRWPTTTG